MIALIAESKTMACAPADTCVSPTRPQFERQALAIVNEIVSMAFDSFAEASRLNPDMARKAYRLALDFRTGDGYGAIGAFNGVVFKGLDYASLDSEARKWIDSNVLIVSALYGLLRPTDGIRPYRLDYGMRVAPGDVTLAAYWSRLLPEALHTDILDLMPADAARTVNVKALARKVNVWKVDFKIADGSTLVTPKSVMLKTLRGRFLREIAQRRISSPSQLTAFESDDFMVESVGNGVITLLANPL